MPTKKTWRFVGSSRARSVIRAGVDWMQLGPLFHFCDLAVTIKQECLFIYDYVLVSYRVPKCTSFRMCMLFSHIYLGSSNAISSKVYIHIYSRTRSHFINQRAQYGLWKHGLKCNSKHRSSVLAVMKNFLEVRNVRYCRNE